MNRSNKLVDAHFARTAAVYVRQSTQNQVLSNKESQRLQYGLVGLARQHGFEAVEVYDADLGRSASGSVDRPGFERLIAAICRGGVGAVYCLEASRLARNGQDWHRLVDLCAVFDVAIVDPEGVYDAATSNDRLLLGLKGTMSEFELRVLRQRSVEAKRAKAARGELQFRLPVGLVWTEADTIEVHPDQRVQEAVGTVFSRFEQLGSVRQVMLSLREDRMTVPRLAMKKRANLTWRIPDYSCIYSMIRNPLYAGAYAYGRHQTSVEVANHRPRKVQTSRPKSIEQWDVLLKEHFTGYISWDAYQCNMKKLEENNLRGKTSSRKTGRGGGALLTGLLRCARCGRRLHVYYGPTMYRCRHDKTFHGRATCISLGATKIDQAVSAAVLRAIDPAAIDEAVEVAAAGTSAATQRTRATELELEEVRHLALIAQERFEGVDPRNRLVAATLETQWNSVLKRLAEVEQRLAADRAAEQDVQVLNLELLQDLAERLPAVWHDPQTEMQLKQRIVALLIEQIIVDVDDDEVQIAIRWVGGRHTEIRHTKRARSSNYTSSNVIDIIRGMAGRWSDENIAGTLNRLQLRTGTGKSWNAKRVASLRRTHKIPNPHCKEKLLTLGQAAKELDVSRSLVRSLIEAGTLPAHQAAPGTPWAIKPKDLLDHNIANEVARRRARTPRPQKTQNQLSIISTA